MSLTLASLALSMLAQAPPPPPSMPIAVTVSAGRGRTWDDEGSIGSGTSAGAGVEWRFRPKLSIGADVERLGHERDTPGLRFSGRTIFVSANVAYRVAARGVTPYVGGGFGGAFYEGTLVDRLRSPAQTIPRSSTSTMAYGMGGVEIPIGGRVAISPDARITFCQPQDDFAPWSTIRFGVKASVRFQAAELADRRLGRVPGCLSSLNKDQSAERGARMTGRDDRETVTGRLAVSQARPAVGRP